jgi:hypothetical protein
MPTAATPQLPSLAGDRNTHDAAVLIKVPPGRHPSLHAHAVDDDAVVTAGTLDSLGSPRQARAKQLTRLIANPPTTQ